jgi:hypothetical protein
MPLWNPRGRSSSTLGLRLFAMGIFVLVLPIDHAHAVERHGGAGEGTLPPVALSAGGRTSCGVLGCVVDV